ncbi:hypothetical protein PWT90_05537 [Aphanocladium album]|nr:hypothetical protein PWT90_05537 [Aphanocladium album]
MKFTVVAFALFAGLVSAGVLDERRPMCSEEGGPCDFRLFECCNNQQLYCNNQKIPMLYATVPGMKPKGSTPLQYKDSEIALLIQIPRPEWLPLPPMGRPMSTLGRLRQSRQHVQQVIHLQRQPRQAKMPKKQRPLLLLRLEFLRGLLVRPEAHAVALERRGSWILRRIPSWRLRLLEVPGQPAGLETRVVVYNLADAMPEPAVIGDGVKDFDVERVGREKHAAVTQLNDLADLGAGLVQFFDVAVGEETANVRQDLGWKAKENDILIR